MVSRPCDLIKLSTGSGRLERQCNHSDMVPTRSEREVFERGLALAAVGPECVRKTGEGSGPAFMKHPRVQVLDEISP